MYPEDEGPDFEMDIPPSDPIGKCPVTFDVPVPTVEQVAGEIARQMIAAESYSYKSGLSAFKSQISDKLDTMIDALLTEKARPLLDELLEKSFQPTDTFGNPTGAAKTLHSVLGESINAWASELVDANGNIGRPDAHNRDRFKPRITHALREIVTRDLTTAVDAEVKKIVATLKGQATQLIASQIAERIANMVIKQ